MARSRFTKGSDEKELWEIKHAPFYCSENHSPAETISTNIMKWICKTHTPVFLFASTEDPVFQLYHLGVRIILLNFSQFTKFCLITPKILIINDQFTFFKKEDPTHPDTPTIGCTRCGVTFNTKILNIIVLKQHEKRCTENEPDLPPFQRVCRQCGRVRSIRLFNKGNQIPSQF